MRRSTRVAVLAVAGVVTLAPPAAAAHGGGHDGAKQLAKIRHFVVVYQENHSFDNLYGGWEGVDGLAGADLAHTTQVDQAGNPYRCLLQNDVNLTSPPLAATCANVTPPFSSHFPNAPFRIEDYIAPSDTTCPPPGVSAPNGVVKGMGLPGGCTRDLVHRFYQEQYQLDGGRQDRYVTGSDAVGLTMGALRHPAPAGLRVPARPRPSAVRDLRPLLPGGVRRVVPEPPVARRGGHAGVHRRAHGWFGRRSALPRRHQRDADVYPLYTAQGAVEGRWR